MDSKGRRSQVTHPLAKAGRKKRGLNGADGLMVDYAVCDNVEDRSIGLLRGFLEAL
jgi:hypothetical protein